MFEELVKELADLDLYRGSGCCCRGLFVTKGPSAGDAAT